MEALGTNIRRRSYHRHAVARILSGGRAASERALDKWGW